MKVKSQNLKIFNIWVSINYYPYSIHSGYLLFFETTLMGNTADLTMVITERGGCSRNAVSKHIKCKVDWKEEIE